MRFRVEQRERSTEPFSAYYYDVFQGNRLIAEYWHDYRGDDHGIRFLGREKDYPFRAGREEYPLFGTPADFLEGGGPTPLELSKRAISYLKERLDQR